MGVGRGGKMNARNNYKKQIEQNARHLDHLAMDALMAENAAWKAKVEKTVEVN
jgi:hypothetical protein